MTTIQDEEELVRIKVKRKTREDLKKMGIKGESYEVIIQRLMKEG